ncbi:hypothetical protein JXA88_12195 [Candidatus Fermentibacteria bacterium]|nr:hypothetical protein [Candidatus Fermentibacteria bacterium]
MTHQGPAEAASPPNEGIETPAVERAAAEGAAEVIADPTAVLDGESGEPAELAGWVEAVPPTSSAGYRCDFCGQLCGVYSRMDFLHGRYHRDFTRN